MCRALAWMMVGAISMGSLSGASPNSSAICWFARWSTSNIAVSAIRAGHSSISMPKKWSRVTFMFAVTSSES